MIGANNDIKLFARCPYVISEKNFLFQFIMDEKRVNKIIKKLKRVNKIKKNNNNNKNK